MLGVVVVVGTRLGSALGTRAPLEQRGMGCWDLPFSRDFPE